MLANNMATASILAEIFDNGIIDQIGMKVYTCWINNQEMYTQDSHLAGTLWFFLCKSSRKGKDLVSHFPWKKFNLLNSTATSQGGGKFVIMAWWRHV